MAEYQTIRTARAGVRTAEIDAGLREHMTKVYGLMSVAMLITAGVAWAVGTNDAMVAAIFGTPLKWVVMFAPLIMVFAFSALINRLSVAAAQLFFYVYAAAVGLSQSAMSQHLALLRDEGVVGFERNGQSIFYRIADPRVEALMATLYQLYCASDDAPSKGN